MRRRKLWKLGRKTVNTPASGKLMVVQNLAITPKQAVNMFNAGTLEDRLNGFYDDVFKFQDEVDIIDITKLDKIERMELLHQKQEQLKQYREDIKAGIARDDVTIQTSSAEPEPETTTE